MRIRFAHIITISLITFLITELCYILMASASTPRFTYWRDLYIETAMTTGRHQWLATDFFPKDIIDQVMGKQVTNMGLIARTNTRESSPVSKTNSAAASVLSFNNKDILNQSHLKIGDLDYAGHKILVNDIKQGLVISEVSGDTFKGKIALIDDPSRIFIGETDKKGSFGRNILDLLNMNNAILGVNASGFTDTGGMGDGGEIIGLSYSNGVPWGNQVPQYGAIAFDSSNRLVVGNVKDWSAYDIRDGVQFIPPLIAEGKSLIEGSGGWGLQPRTIIGQRQDGAVIFLVIDGRQPGYSLGATLGDCANLLLSYGVVTAGCCDGGSSSIMGYDGALITRSSSPQGGGRFLPNAFLVKRKY